VASFGFRGEALSSLCEISGRFEVLTRTPMEPIGARLVYDR
jgi:DNA mismatch repair protein PMS2